MGVARMESHISRDLGDQKTPVGTDLKMGRILFHQV